jgi:hypothetical protein
MSIILYVVCRNGIRNGETSVRLQYLPNNPTYFDDSSYWKSTLNYRGISFKANVVFSFFIQTESMRYCTPTINRVRVLCAV